MFLAPSRRREAPPGGLFLAPAPKRRRAPPEPAVVATDRGEGVVTAYLVSDPGLRTDERWSQDQVALVDSLCVRAVVYVGWRLHCPGVVDPSVEAIRERARAARPYSSSVG